jgi:hypothetical protein
MSLSMFQASVPVYVQHLTGLTGVLQKGADFSAAKKIDPAVLLGSRIYPDMFPLSRQIRESINHSANACARIAGIELPKLPDSEATFEDLQARVAAAQTFLKGLKAEQIDGTEDKTVIMQFSPTASREFKGQAFLMGFALPNFFFHTTIAYAILRQYGVEVGKRDFMGPR